MSNDLDEEFRQLRGARRRRRIITVSIIALLGMAPFLWIGSRYLVFWREEEEEVAKLRLTGEEKAELERLADKLGERASAGEAAWKAAATREALERVVVDEAPCDVTLQAPSIEAGKSYVQYGSIDGNYFGDWGLRLVRAGQEIGRCDDCASLRYQADAIREDLDRGRADRNTLERARRSAAGRGRDSSVVVLVDEEQQPAGGLGGRFVPGRVRGRAFLYSGGRQRFICAADIEATSSFAVNTRYSYMKDNFLDQMNKAAQAVSTSLQRDLEMQVRRAVADALRQIR